MNERNRLAARGSRTKAARLTMAELLDAACSTKRLRQIGLEHLAAMEHWIAMPAKSKTNKFDYKLTPRKPDGAKPVLKKPGRKPAKRVSVDQPVDY